MSKKNEHHDAPTPQDSSVMDALQQISADINKAIKLQKKDPDNGLDKDDIKVLDMLNQLDDDVHTAIQKQAQDGAADARAQALVREVRAQAGAREDTRVVFEPRTYTEHGPHSYFRDSANAHVMKYIDQTRDFSDAEARLQRHAQEIEADYREGNEYVRRQLGEVRRRSGEAETRGPTGETTNPPTTIPVTGSSANTQGGVFVAPQYLIDKWITYRSADRSFTNQCTTLPLPAYGVSFNIPSFTNYGAGNIQSGYGLNPYVENVGVDNQSPTGAPINVVLTTFAGVVPMSQQLFDRAGYEGQGGSFDVIVIQQSQDQLFANIDASNLAAAISSGTAVNQSTAASTKQFYLDLATARNNLADSAGVRLPGTHVFSTSDFTGWLESQVDSQNRPIVVPDAASLVAREGDYAYAGWNGVYLPGNLKWFSNDNILTATKLFGLSGYATQTTILVGSPADMLCFMGDMVPFTAQQTRAGTLSVICGLRQYAAFVPRHAGAFSYITGSGYNAATLV